MNSRHRSEMSEEEKDCKAIEVQESILADLEELVIGTTIAPKRSIESAVYARIAELKKTIGLLRARRLVRRRP